MLPPLFALHFYFPLHSFPYNFPIIFIFIWKKKYIKKRKYPCRDHNRISSNLFALTTNQLIKRLFSSIIISCFSTKIWCMLIPGFFFHDWMLFFLFLCQILNFICFCLVLCVAPRNSPLIVPTSLSEMLNLPHLKWTSLTSPLPTIYNQIHFSAFKLRMKLRDYLH